MLVWSIFSVLFLLVMFWLFRYTNLKTDRKGAAANGPDDGFLFDPVTGRQITVEEAEAGIVLPEGFTPRIKSDEEIQSNPNPEEREIEYIRRECIHSKWQGVNMEPIDVLLGRSELFRSLRSYSITDLWKVNNDLMVGLAYISNDYNPTYETQLIAILHGTLRSKQIDSLQYAEYEPIGNFVFIRIPKKATLSDFENVVMLLSE